MKKIYLVCILMSFVLASNAQILINNINETISQDFNTLANSGTTNAITTLPTGFTFLETGTNANTTYTADNGGLNGGNTYSFGTTSATERALGGIQSGNLNPSIGVSFTNNTSTAITSITLNYTGEQWRLGATNRADRLDFQYSTNATSLNTGTYIDVDNLDFTAPITVGTFGALDGNLATNRLAISFTIANLNISPGSTFWFKWNDFNATGADDGLAIDDLSVSFTGGSDTNPPTITNLSPADNAINVSINTNLNILFSEPIQKGTGNILIRKVADNSIVQTIDVTDGIVLVAGNQATIANNPFENNTDYYIQVANTAFMDAAGNFFAGITDPTTWNFRTAPAPANGIVGNNYTFGDCVNTFIAEGFSQFSVIGAGQIWGCTANGRLDANAVQMNGFSGSSLDNEDWLISPKFDLTTVPFPALRFYSRGEFMGNDLVLKVSTNYVYGTNPNTATWTNVNGNFPTTNVFTLSDNINLSAFNAPNVYIAWFYTSSTAPNTAKRWTIDDIIVFNNAPLAPCAEPSTQPTNLLLTANATSVSGSFTVIPSPTTVENYLVVRSLSATLSALPVDGTTYSPGQTLNGGNGTVVRISGDGTFNDNVSPSTQYYYFVFAMNDVDCGGGPNYNQVNPLTATITTPALAPCVTPNAPTALVLTPNNTTISGSFTASGASKYLTIISTSTTLNTPPINGTVYTVGQTLGNGTIVSYNATQGFNASGLTVATNYSLFVFAANDGCSGEPFYSTVSLTGSTTTTNNTQGIPAGYYDAAAAQNCQSLKTNLKNIITTNSQVLSYTPGLWNLYEFSDLHRNDQNTADIIWDMYSDNPTGPEPYTYTLRTNQCGNISGEGSCYNREHSTPQSWFAEALPMRSDAHHVFPTDGSVNGLRSSFPYGEVTNATTTSQNGSKLGTGNNFGYTSTVFEPINAYKGDFARAGLYMAVRYEDEIISQNWSGRGSANEVFLSPTDEPDPVKRRLQIYDAWHLNLLIKWHNQDAVSQKEIDRNNAVYYTTVNTTTAGDPRVQSNRNPFVDHPEYVALTFQCTGVVPVTIIDFTARNNNDNVLLQWYATFETSFKKFEIERSTDGINFNKVGVIDGQNLANYSFNDNKLPKATVVFYRLKMVDIDGKFEYSKIVSVKLNSTISNAVVYPNPTISDVNVRLYEPLFSNSTLLISDATGRILKQISVNANATNINVNVEQLAAGRYFIQIKNSAQVINQTFIKLK